MIDQNENPSFQTYERTIAAGDSVEINREASAFSVISATGAFKMALGATAPEFEAEAGIGFESARHWRTTRLINEGGAPVVVVVGLALGRIIDNRVTIPANTSIGVTAGSTADSDAATACASGAATQVLAANATRRTAIICNDDAAATIYVSFANSASARGIKLPPGGVATLDTTAAIYVYQASGGSVNVLGSEVEA